MNTLLIHWKASFADGTYITGTAHNEEEYNAVKLQHSTATFTDWR